MRTKAFATPLIALALLASACGGIGSDNGSGSSGSSGGVSGGRTAIEHPTAPDDLVLRIDTSGGFVAVQSSLRSIPQISIYGDGRMIVQGPQIEIYPGPALPNLQVSQLSEADLQVILAAARDAGLLGADADYPYPCVADLPTTTFTVNAGGSTHTVTAYALGFGAATGASGGSSTGATGGSGIVGSSGGVASGSGSVGANGTTSTSKATGSSGALAATGSGCGDVNVDARRQLSAFETRLGDLGSWVPDAPGAEQPYIPTEMRIFVSAYQRDPQLRQRPVPWPLDTSLATFGTADANLGDLRCGAIGGGDLASVLPLAEGANELTPWRSDGAAYALVFRPLLPDEHDC